MIIEGLCSDNASILLSPQSWFEVDFHLVRLYETVLKWCPYPSCPPLHTGNTCISIIYKAYIEYIDVTLLHSFDPVSNAISHLTVMDKQWKMPNRTFTLFILLINLQTTMPNSDEPLNRNKLKPSCNKLNKVHCYFANRTHLCCVISGTGWIQSSLTVHFTDSDWSEVLSSRSQTTKRRVGGWACIGMHVFLCQHPYSAKILSQSQQ